MSGRFVGRRALVTGARRGIGAGIAADLSDEQERQRIVPQAVELLGGPVDILVNNAVAASVTDRCLRQKENESNLRPPVVPVSACARLASSAERDRSHLEATCHRRPRRPE